MRLLYLLPLAILGGCAAEAGPKLKTVAQAPLEPGWTQISDAETGISIAIPSGWRQGVSPSVAAIDPQMLGIGTGASSDGAQPDLQGMQSAIEDSNKADADKKLKALREKGIILIANDGSRTLPAEIPTRIYVQMFKNVGSLDAVRDAEATNLFNEENPTEVELPVGKAIRFVADVQNRIGDRETHVSYCFIDGNVGYALRLTSTNNPGIVLDNERKVAESFRKQ